MKQAYEVRLPVAFAVQLLEHSLNFDEVCPESVEVPLRLQVLARGADRDAVVLGRARRLSFPELLKRVSAAKLVDTP